MGVGTIKGHNGKRNENGVLGGELTWLHEISGNCSAGMEAFWVTGKASDLLPPLKVQPTKNRLSTHVIARPKRRFTVFF